MGYRKNEAQTAIYTFIERAWSHITYVYAANGMNFNIALIESVRKRASRWICNSRFYSSTYLWDPSSSDCLVQLCKVAHYVHLIYQIIPGVFT